MQEVHLNYLPVSILQALYKSAMNKLVEYLFCGSGINRDPIFMDYLKLHYQPD
jgi:hypothetical protein